MKYTMKGITIPLMTLLTSFVLLTLPVSAAESVIIPVEFNTESNESFNVAVLGEGNCASAGTPAECTPGVAFNCSDTSGDCEWGNPKGNSGAPTTQDPASADQAIFILTNDGTATLNVAFEGRDDIYTTDNCLNMTYTMEQEASCVTTDYGATNFTGQLKDSAITVDASFTPAETQHCIWLFGNFSGCSSGVDATFIYFNSTVA